MHNFFTSASEPLYSAQTLEEGEGALGGTGCTLNTFPYLPPYEGRVWTFY